MKKILRKQKSGYALSFVLWLLGIVAVFWVIWKTWPEVSVAGNPFSVFWDSLWTETLVSVSGVEFKLLYLAVLGTALIVSGFLMFSVSRKWFTLGGQIRGFSVRSVTNAGEQVQTRRWFTAHTATTSFTPFW